jgi:non-heme chloroperoxidase
MPYVTIGAENSGRIDLYYEDHGAATPVVLIHGYPLSGHSWEKQVRDATLVGSRMVRGDRAPAGGHGEPAASVSPAGLLPPPLP